MHVSHDRKAIKFLTGPQTNKAFQITDAVTTIGRNASQCDIVVEDPTVSRKHIEILWENGIWSIRNISSGNQVRVNDQDIPEGQQRWIAEQDHIYLGQDSSFQLISSIPPLAEQNPPHVSTVYAQPGDLASLEISSNAGQATRIYPLTQQVINIGRDYQNDIVISENIISAWHLQIVHEARQFVLIHPHPKQQQTTNGLYYRGQRIRGDEQFRKVLTHRDVFRIGNEAGTLVTLSYNNGSGTIPEAQSEMRSIPLLTLEVTIGRHDRNAVVLNHPQISAFHAHLVREQETYRIIDLGSTNHVYVNGLQVKQHLLQVGDEIHIGPLKFIYAVTELIRCDESKSIRIDAFDLKKLGNNQTVLLNDISLAIPACAFVALVGGSGAGKSTLLDALSGLRPAQAGLVFYNGQNYYQTPVAYHTQLGYVPQDDIIHRDLTVERALYYAARLRLPDDFTVDQIKQRIDEVLKSVEMTHRRTLLISKLSGGQRKRVSIALELLAKPSIFFLDEPTSGLDPGLDRKMMLLLRTLADGGHTILLVTHATNNISACDYICFLAPGGSLAYFGPPDKAKAFFGQSDFAEIYSLLEPTEHDKTIPARAAEKFKQSVDYQRYVEAQLDRPLIKTNITSARTSESKRSRSGNKWKQFALLSMRYIELLKNDMSTLLILLLQAPLIGLVILGVIHYQNNSQVFKTPILPGSQGSAQKYLFLMAFACVLFGSINAAREIVKEIHIYRRERIVNLGIIPYLLSKLAVLGVLSLLQSFMLLLIVNYAAPFHDGIFLPAFWEVYITLALTVLASTTLGLMISALVPNNDRAMTVVTPVLILQVIFSGLIFPISDGPLQLMGTLMAIRWGMAALGSSLGLNNHLFGNDKLIGTYNTYQHAQDHLLLTWSGLLVMIILLSILTGCILRLKERVPS